ncbi:MAG: hypothetical protein E6J62_02705 [Deltaproteobacteria bacterium]|nr:MAG: hypothetical protein E6J61_01295 [Deltaproteobacteria bacterium]TMB38908.1 MAG: hypothetical protein E6J62_02705 [Deltaproteobacteria bacterium]
MPSIHFICRRGLNLQVVKHPVYESGVWDIEKDAPRLVGGMMFLHETKADKSYFGGRIESYRVVETDEAHSRRVVFTVTSLREGKGASWRGTAHGMAWTSGVVEDAT